METARIEWISDRGRFTEVRDAWDRLADHHPDPFARRAWIDPWLDAFAPNDRPAICLIWRGRELAAGLVMLDRHGGRVAATNVHTPVLRPLAVDEEAEAHLVDTVVRAAPFVRIGPLPSREPVTQAVAARARANGRLLTLETTEVSPVTLLSGEFTAYREARRQRWRELERRGRKAEREHDVTFELMHGRIDDLLEEGLALEASGWKHRRGTAILDSPATATFYRDVAHRFADRGELALCGLRFDGVLVAFDLALIHARRFWLLKTAFDEQHRTLGPGLLLRRAVIERCFSDGLEAHEFLGPDMPWKRLFAEADRPHVTLRLFAKRPVPLTMYAWRRARPTVRRAFRRIRPENRLS